MNPTFLNGPLSKGKKPPQRIQIFATHDQPSNKPDQVIRIVAGCYILDHHDANEAVYSWRKPTTESES